MRTACQTPSSPTSSTATNADQTRAIISRIISVVGVFFHREEQRRNEDRSKRALKPLLPACRSWRADHGVAEPPIISRVHVKPVCPVKKDGDPTRSLWLPQWAEIASKSRHTIVELIGQSLGFPHTRAVRLGELWGERLDCVFQRM